MSVKVWESVSWLRSMLCGPQGLQGRAALMKGQYTPVNTHTHMLSQRRLGNQTQCLHLSCKVNFGKTGTVYSIFWCRFWHYSARLCLGAVVMQHVINSLTWSKRCLTTTLTCTVARKAVNTKPHLEILTGDRLVTMPVCIRARLGRSKGRFWWVLNSGRCTQGGKTAPN